MEKAVSLLAGDSWFLERLEILAELGNVMLKNYWRLAWIYWNHGWRTLEKQYPDLLESWSGKSWKSWILMGRLNGYLNRAICFTTWTTWQLVGCTVGGSINTIIILCNNIPLSSALDLEGLWPIFYFLLVLGKLWWLWFVVSMVVLMMDEQR